MAAVDDLHAPRRVVIVGTNAQVATRHVVYDLAGLGLGTVGRHARVTRYRTSAGEDVQPLGAAPLSTPSVADDQPPGSITTYVIDLS